MSAGISQNVRPSSVNGKKTRKTAGENEIVGAKRNTKPRISPSVIEQGFHTDKYKTHYSAWTPIIHSASNSQIFIERLDLIGHWFSMWTDAQRKTFMTFILKKCTKSQLRFVNEGWFKKQLPIQHLDFTTVLPRFISTYILSFLDPRTICRAAQVSWHWKFLSEQDVIWIPKCLRFGWYLAYTPNSRENGCWKHHYILCTYSLDMEAPTRMVEMYGQFADNHTKEMQEKDGKQKAVCAKRRVKDVAYYRQETRRPPWLGPDPNPPDLENARKALLYEHNPNLPQSPHQMRTERLGLSTRPQHRRSHTAPAHMHTKKVTVSKSSEEGDVNGNVVEEGKEPIHPSKLTLTEALAVESGVDESLVEQPWSKPLSTSPVRRQDLTLGIHPSVHGSLLPTRSTQALQSCPNPTVIFISSEVPACELLLAAVMLGVIAIPYEYEGTTLDVLMEKLRLVLQGRQAKSIGIFTRGESGTVRLVKGKTLSETTINEPNMRHFWETVTTNVSTRESGGHIDIFLPLVETEQGMDLLVQLGLLTDMQFSCPTGTTGSLARAESAWLFVPNGVTPPALYFNMTKLGAWSETVDYIEECVDVVKKNLHSFFNEEKRNLANRLIGQITFEALGMCEVYKISKVASALVEAVICLGRSNASENWSDPVQGLIHYLQNYGHKDKKVRKTLENGEAAAEETSDNDFEEAFKAKELKIPISSQEFPSKTGTSAGDKRTLVAQEILSSELAYMKCLSVIQNVFKKPLQAALASNRAIISLANIQSLFSDSEALLVLSGALSNDLSNRLEEWNSHQMLGDIFLNFTTQLRAYTNFLNNYPVTLQTLERCKEQNPQFRSFLGRHEKQPSTKMMNLAELLFLPGKRIKSYVELLESFLRYTPSDHLDRGKLTKAIAKFKDLDGLFRQYKERLERETFLQDLQKRIVNCPVLAEKSRYFIREDDVILLSTPNIGKQVKPEFRVYQQVGDVGLFLFNDALLVATLTFKFVPFQRLIRRNYKFQVCLSLRTLKVENLADSKYVKNAFTIVSPKRLWLCQAHSWEQKYQWISVLESSITAALEKL